MNDNVKNALEEFELDDKLAKNIYYQMENFANNENILTIFIKKIRSLLKTIKGKVEMKQNDNFEILKNIFNFVKNYKFSDTDLPQLKNNTKIQIFVFFHDLIWNFIDILDKDGLIRSILIGDTKNFLCQHILLSQLVFADWLQFELKPLIEKQIITLTKNTDFKDKYFIKKSLTTLLIKACINPTELKLKKLKIENSFRFDRVEPLNENEIYIISELVNKAAKNMSGNGKKYVHGFFAMTFLKECEFDKKYHESVLDLMNKHFSGSNEDSTKNAIINFYCELYLNNDIFKSLTDFSKKLEELLENNLEFSL
ncbi:hypothetical protein ACQ4LE_002525 [Meloidogyne hapla]